MDVTLFLVGVALIIVATAMSIINQASAASASANGGWTGTVVSGGSGLLAVSYTSFVSKPRAQVKAATDHLMYIKVVFLGYLRELGQIDQVRPLACLPRHLNRWLHPPVTSRAGESSLPPFWAFLAAPCLILHVLFRPAPFSRFLRARPSRGA